MFQQSLQCAILRGEQLTSNEEIRTRSSAGGMYEMICKNRIREEAAAGCPKEKLVSGGRRCSKRVSVCAQDVSEAGEWEGSLDLPIGCAAQARRSQVAHPALRRLWLRKRVF